MAAANPEQPGEKCRMRSRKGLFYKAFLDLENASEVLSHPFGSRCCWHLREVFL